MKAVDLFVDLENVPARWMKVNDVFSLQASNLHIHLLVRNVWVQIKY